MSIPQEIIDFMVQRNYPIEKLEIKILEIEKYHSLGIFRMKLVYKDGLYHVLEKNENCDLLTDSEDDEENTDKNKDNKDHLNYKKYSFDTFEEALDFFEEESPVIPFDSYLI